MDTINYSKLRLDVLENIISDRGIECKLSKNEMVKHLLLDDEGKYVRETTYEKYGKDQFLVGIDLKNIKHSSEIGKLIEKGEAKRLNMYFDNRLHYITNIKLSENGME
jgi:hypothetical protein